MSAILRAKTPKWPVEVILNAAVPEKSKCQYQKTYEEFREYSCLQRDQAPAEEHV